MSLMGGVGGALLPPVVMSIIADASGVKAGVGEAKAEMNSIDMAANKAAGVGSMAMAGLAIGVAAVGVESTKLAMNFDQTMELIHTQAMAPQSAVDALSGKVLDLAGVVGQAPGSLAEGLYHIASVLGPQVMSSAQGQAQAMDILTQSAKLASMGMANLDDVTYAMSGVMSVGMKDINNASDAVAFMNATVGMGDMRMQDLSLAIGTGVLPAFKSAGLGMADFSAALATITDNSTPANEAATRLRMTIALMAAPSGPAIDALGSIGIGATQLANDLTQPNGLLVAVQDLKSHLAGLSTVDANAVIEHAFGGGKTSGAIQTLLQETDKLQGKYDALGTSADRAKNMDQAWADQQKQFSQQWHEMTAQVEAFGVKIGNWLIPKIEGVVHFFERHKTLAKDLGIAIAMVTVALIGLSIAMWLVALNPVGIVIGLIIIGVALLIVGILELVQHWGTVWNWIKRIAGDVWHWIYQYVWIDGLYKAFAWFRDDVPRYASEAWDKIAGFFVHYWNDIYQWVWTDGIMKAVDWFRYDVPKFFSDTWDKIKGFFTHTWDDIYQWVWVDGIMKAVDWFKSIPGMIATAFVGLAHIVGGPFVSAFNWVADAWNNTIGQLSWTVPSWVPFIGGDTIRAPWLPHVALNFDQGGVVPGPVGAPQAAIVHGGEGVLTVDQMAALRNAAGGGGGTAGDVVVHQHIYLDSKEIREGQLRIARRKGQSASTLLPSTVGALP